MGVQQNNTRERVFSILNDNDCPSFVIRQKQSSASQPQARLPSISSLSPRLERPSFQRYAAYKRNSSVSSAGSPPLIRYDSTSSKSSSSSMESTPSPITPAYPFTDAATLQYDSLRPDLGAPYLQSPSTITPYLQQQMMLPAGTAAQLPAFEPKSMVIPAPSAPFPVMPLPQESQQLHPPSLSNQGSSSSNSSSTLSKSSPTSNGNQTTSTTVKKNKYPCPYATSHNCMATFTTSGHAARHGKKHTGEKGVHCPVCNKAFTRKDNMKQHERTHKNNRSKNNDESRSKAAITKDAQKAKAHKKSDSETSTNNRRPSVIQSPLSEAPSLGLVDTPVNIVDAGFYPNPSPPMLLAPDSSLIPEGLTSTSMYPPLGDESFLGVPSIAKLDNTIPMPPTLVRGFSDLDTLAQAAESFDPYYQGQFSDN